MQFSSGLHRFFYSIFLDTENLIDFIIEKLID